MTASQFLAARSAKDSSTTARGEAGACAPAAAAAAQVNTANAAARERRDVRERERDDMGSSQGLVMRGGYEWCAERMEGKGARGAAPPTGRRLRPAVTGPS